MNVNLLSSIHRGKPTSQIVLPLTTSADAYVQNTNFDSHSLDSSKHVTLVEVKNMDDYHKNHNIIHLDSMTDLTRPSMDYINYISEYAHLDKAAAAVAATSEVVYYNGYKCESGHDVYNPYYVGGPYSPYKRDKVSSNSAYRLAHRLSKLQDLLPNESLYNIGIDLTFPDYVSKIAYQDPKKAEAIATKCVNVFLKSLSKEKRWVRHKGQKLFNSFNVHLWHSHNPDCVDEIHTPTVPHLHVHLNLINAVCDSKDPNYKLTRFNPIIPRYAIKVAWQYALFKQGFNVPEPDFYIHHCSLKHKGKLTHRIRYCGRSPLNDLYSYFNDTKFDKSNVQTTFNEYLVNYKNPRHTCGALRLLSKLLPVEDIEDEEICPVCSEKSEYLGKITKDEIHQMVSDGSVSVVHWSSRKRRYFAIERGSMDSVSYLDYFDTSELHEALAYSNGV
jgi:hypothetical protein